MSLLSSCSACKEDFQGPVCPSCFAPARVVDHGLPTEVLAPVTKLEAAASLLELRSVEFEPTSAMVIKGRRLVRRNWAAAAIVVFGSLLVLFFRGQWVAHREKQALQHFTEGASFYHQQKYTQAEEEWVAAGQLFESLDQGQSQADTYYWLSRALAERTLYDVAADYVARADEVDPRDGFDSWRSKLLRMAGMQSVMNSRASLEAEDFHQARSLAEKAQQLLEEGGAEDWQLKKAESLMAAAEKGLEDDDHDILNDKPLVRKPRPAESRKVVYAAPKAKYPTYRPRYDDDDDDGRRKKKKKKKRPSVNRSTYVPKTNYGRSAPSTQSASRSSSSSRSRSRNSYSPGRSTYRPKTSSSKYTPSRTSSRKKNLYRSSLH